MFSNGEAPQCHELWGVEKFSVEDKNAKYKSVRKFVLQYPTCVVKVAVSSDTQALCVEHLTTTMSGGR